MKTVVRSLAVVALATLSFEARAETHNVPIGGRTATMGGAGIAHGNDSAMPYLNPAGVAGIPSDVLGLSATVYRYSAYSLPNVLAPNGYAPVYGNVHVDSSNAATSVINDVPSTIMFMHHFGDAEPEGMHHTVGISLVVPHDAEYSFVLSQHASLPGVKGAQAQALTLENATRSYFVGPTWATAFGTRLRLGGTVFGILSENEATASNTIAESFSNGSRAAQYAINYSEKDRSYGWTAVVGAQAELLPDVWLGASGMLPTMTLGGTEGGTSGYSASVDTFAGSTRWIKSAEDYQGRYVMRPPGRAGMGVAWDRHGRFAVALDVVYTFSRRSIVRYDDTSTSVQGQSGQADRRVVVRSSNDQPSDGAFDFSAGFEMWIHPLASVRVGAFSDRAGANVDPNAQIFAFGLEAYGATLGLGIETGPFDLTFGGVYRHADGSLTVNDNTNKASLYTLASGGAFNPPGALAEAHVNTFMFVVSGVVTAAEARDQIRKALPVALPGDPLGGGKP